MAEDIFINRFSSDQPSLSIRELQAWRQQKIEGTRLLLPPIQRSIVWNNEQVINYWDSLLRGYPAGMMMVNRTLGKGRDKQGNTCAASEGDYHLFDGQQRMTAILLGFGEGQMKASRRLWIDFGTEPNKSSGLKYQLRITSTGQPFGYRPDAPNQKIELKKRAEKWEQWQDRHDQSTIQEAFEKANGLDLIYQKCAYPLKDVCDHLKHGRSAAIAELLRIGAIGNVEEFVIALEKALDSKVILQQVGSEIVDDQEEYIRFFGRLGQGGTPLSDDELTYSILKNQYPDISDLMSQIMQSVGRIAGEVDFVLGALRVAKALASWTTANGSERSGRPTPAFVSQLKEQKFDEVRLIFLELIGLEGHASTLVPALTNIRAMLCDQPLGLPSMLLARLPRGLVDVLILFAMKHGSTQVWGETDSGTLRAFVLYWLVFVGYDDKAAMDAFQQVKKESWSFSQESIRNLIGVFESEGRAHFIPRKEMMAKLREEVEQGDHMLKPSAKRFQACDRDNDSKPGEALRMLSTNHERITRALMWLQRDYINKYDTYDPTSDRDEDLPIDRDHIIPQDVFGFHWKSFLGRLDEDVITEDVIRENFRWQRDVVGNSLGNFRWLDARVNRSRGNGNYVPIENDADLVNNPDEWKKINPADSGTQKWSRKDIATFQYLVDKRTLELYEKLLTESGIENILPM